MKKILSTIVAIFLLANTVVFASEIEIQPTFISRTNAQDRVWVGAFQLVWNDFIDKIVFGPIRFREGTPTFVRDLNAKTFTVNHISEKSYYKYVGKVKKNTKRQISKAIKKKFKESSDILNKLDLTARNDMYLIYAMLKKDFEFLNAFDKLGRFEFSEDSVADYFGIGADSEKHLAEGVKVLFYNDPTEFAVRLATTGPDEVYIYKNKSNKAFNSLYDEMWKKELLYKGDKRFGNLDELRVPNISISEEKVFEELTNKRVMGTNLVIDKALETIKFEMNNKGVELKSEAAMTIVTTSLSPEDISPRLFYFDDTFVLFVKEKGKRKPYFAMRVNDITKFQQCK